jgi:hypothetical protein
MADTATTTATKAKPKTTAAKKTTTAKASASTATPKKAAPRTSVQRAQDAAEKAVLVQVGAVLIARDQFVDAVTAIAKTDVKAAERRGATARKRVESQLRSRRTSLTKQAKANRKRVEHDIKSLRSEFEARAQTPRAVVDQIVETGRTVTSKVAERAPKLPSRA